VSQNEDKVFMRHFTTLMVVLVMFTIVVAFFGAYLGGKNSPDGNNAQQTSLEKRLQSPAAVYTGNAAPKIVAPVVAAAVAPAETPTAETADAASTENTAADIDGAAIYQTACFACHGTGVAGAPKLEAAAWADRLGQGEDTLVDHAINGFNAMPPKGGQMQLSDAEIRAVVQHMMAQVQ
jgi:cytochrome c5